MNSCHVFFRFFDLLMRPNRSNEPFKKPKPCSNPCERNSWRRSGGWNSCWLVAESFMGALLLNCVCVIEFDASGAV